jgi:K+-sensing histidine kinase KdpD
LIGWLCVARIVGNLIDNAEKYSRRTTDRTIRLAAIDRSDVVEVTVSDRGPGIPDSSKLFLAFSRGVSGGDVPAGLCNSSIARALRIRVLTQPIWRRRIAIPPIE